MVPSTGNFFTPLRLVDAFQEYDEFFALSRRKYVPPNFAEIRHILNIAQARVPHTGRLNYAMYALGCDARSMRRAMMQRAVP